MQLISLNMWIFFSVNGQIWQISLKYFFKISWKLKLLSKPFPNSYPIVYSLPEAAPSKCQWQHDNKIPQVCSLGGIVAKSTLSLQNRQIIESSTHSVTETGSLEQFHLAKLKWNSKKARKHLTDPIPTSVPLSASSARNHSTLERCLFYPTYVTKLQ